MASCRGLLEACQLLLEQGASREARDCRGRTALLEAAARGHTGLLELLQVA